MYGCRYCGKHAEFDEHQVLVYSNSHFNGKTIVHFDHKYTCNNGDCLKEHIHQYGTSDKVIVMRYIMSQLELQFFKADYA